MICMGEAGMKRVLFKIIVPVLILVLWILMCYPVCQQENGFDYFLIWIMVGFPYGIAVFVEIIKMIAGTFCHDVQKCDRRDIM